jgi:molybdopterin-binding protein
MSTAGADAYRLSGVAVDYGNHRVLDVPDLAIPAGRITALVGPNGSGKSTLLRVLALLLAPSRGAVELHGQAVPRRPNELTALRRQVTYVAQTPLLFHGSVRANVAYGLRVRGIRDAGRVDAALDAIGLNGAADRAVHRLSGGEAHRVALARALAIDVPILLLDEPTAHLDPAAVPAIEALLRRLGDAGKTLVIASHDLRQADRLGHVVLALAGGRVMARPLVTVLRGRTVQRGSEAYFESEGLVIEMPDERSVGAIAIGADDVIVSRARLDSSARNCFPGQITRVDRAERGIVLTIDCGTPLLARITPHSYAELGLNIGTRVYVTFKASAIHPAE